MGWSPDGSTVVFSPGAGKYKSVDVNSGKVAETSPQPSKPIGEPNFRLGPGPNYQFTKAKSADNSWTAQSNGVDIIASNGVAEVNVTQALEHGPDILYGKIPWVYCEELHQVDSMLWSPDGSKLLFYKFNNAGIPPYYLALKQLSYQDSLYTELYPKVGGKNPSADLYVFDMKTRKSTYLAMHTDSDPLKDQGHYVYGMAWSPDGASVLSYRLNRRQDTLQLVVADPSTGGVRPLFSRTRKEGWFEPTTAGDAPMQTPEFSWLPGSNRQFLFISDDSGYRNIELYDKEDGLLKKVTRNQFDARKIEYVDAKSKRIWYTAQGEDNPYLVQLRQINLDGTKDSRITNLNLSHRVVVSPTGSGFIDVEQRLNIPPTTTLRGPDGRVIATLATTDLSAYTAWGGHAAEPVQVTAADGKTKLYGYVMVPSTFEKSRKYPLLLNVYCGPNAGNDEEVFTPSEPMTEFGYICAWFDGRGSRARGTQFKFPLFRGLNGAEVDDQAAAVRQLRELPYIDGSKIGVYGASYGGTVTVMCMLRYPELFHAGVASSLASDDKNYDTIYTERYMGLPVENEAAYAKSLVLDKVKNLKGDLLIYFGTADINVHPSHSFNLFNALDRAGKRYEIAVGADQGHSLIDETKMIDFFNRKFYPEGSPKGN